MGDLKPINTGNAKTINEICSPILKLSMLRYEAIFDFYSEEPYTVNVQIKEGEDKFRLDQILRIRKWGMNTKSYSWCIYSKQREWNSNSYSEMDDIFVIRQVIWDMKADMDIIKKCSPGNKHRLIDSWPSICTKNICIDLKDTRDLIKEISEVDKLIDQGFMFELNNNPTWDWKDFELKRLFDWGGIHCTWSPIKNNVAIEEKVDEFEKHINRLISSSNFEINSLDLDYSIKPDIFKKSITGKE